ncbi:MAG: glucose-6-phosphate isomerase [Planctomycetota bacterium]|nr:MAG: glucose-6-phosphate isomerase [Planctomycetota bacterium]
MALKLDLTGLLAPPGSGGAPCRETFAAALPRGAEVRDAHLAAPPAWRRLPEEGRHLAACRARAEEVLAERPELVVVLGIGGSALGASALFAALGPVHPEWSGDGPPRVIVLDSIDPDWVGEVFERIPADRCHFNVISKSGGTIETSAQFLVAWDAVRAACGDDAAARRRFTITTDPAGGHFRRLADELGFATLEVPPGVGGRFSVLSPVGLFPAVLGGLDAEGLLAGAARTFARTAAAAPEEDPALAWALAHVLHMEAGRPIHVHFPYGHRLRLLADWFLQLWAESLGKRLDLAGEEVQVGPTPVKAVGPTDQHSQCQLYAEGPDDKVYTFVRLERHGRELPLPEPFADSPAFAHLRRRSLNELIQAEREGTEAALLAAGRPLCTLTLCKLDAFHVGQYFAFFEEATALAGGLLGIDPYDQPGVEAGKLAALALMGCPGHEERAERIRAERAAREPFVLEC